MLLALNPIKTSFKRNTIHYIKNYHNTCYICPKLKYSLLSKSTKYYHNSICHDKNLINTILIRTGKQNHYERSSSLSPSSFIEPCQQQKKDVNYKVNNMKTSYLNNDNYNSEKYQTSTTSKLSPTTATNHNHLVPNSKKKKEFFIYTDDKWSPIINNFWDKYSFYCTLILLLLTSKMIGLFLHKIHEEFYSTEPVWY